MQLEMLFEVESHKRVGVGRTIKKNLTGVDSHAMTMAYIFQFQVLSAAIEKAIE